MKISITSILFVSFLISGCTIPCDVYFRNFSNAVVRVQATLVSRQYFNKLPNTVNFYDTAQKLKDIHGHWKYQQLVNWIDSSNFFMDVPPGSVIDVADISNGLVLGSGSPDVLLVVLGNKIADTLTTGNYPSLAVKFKKKSALFARPVYYYDYR